MVASRFGLASATMHLRPALALLRGMDGQGQRRRGIPRIDGPQRPGKSADNHRPNVPSWQTNTMPLLQIGRAGALTPAQERRSRGGA
jgi:hypothetical protein